jgi:hypothetical protein
MCDAEDVFEAETLTLNHLVEIWKQCTLEKVGKLGYLSLNLR